MSGEFHRGRVPVLLQLLKKSRCEIEFFVIVRGAFPGQGSGYCEDHRDREEMLRVEVIECVEVAVDPRV